MELDMDVFWQAHRGGGAHEAPDNTIAAFNYTWRLGGIPEADVRTTADGVIVCLHDSTLARTTTAPEAIRNIDVGLLSFGVIRKWDAGIGFGTEYEGQKVPPLEEVFASMQGHPERQVYLDLKTVDLDVLGRMIAAYEVGKQVLIASPRQSDCKTFSKINADLRTMIWIGGTREEIEHKFQVVIDSGFDGTHQVQLHLNDRTDRRGEDAWRYQLDLDFLERACQVTCAANIDLEVFPFQFDQASLHRLLDLGIRWFATDEPARFQQGVAAWRLKS